MIKTTSMRHGWRKKLRIQQNQRVVHTFKIAYMKSLVYRKSSRERKSPGLPCSKFGNNFTEEDGDDGDAKYISTQHPHYKKNGQDVLFKNSCISCTFLFGLSQSFVSKKKQKQKRKLTLRSSLSCNTIYSKPGDVSNK